MPSSPPLSDFTEERLTKVFGPLDSPRAASLLVGRCGYMELHVTSEKAVERIRCAAIKLSEGSLDNLQDAIALAHLDWRDLLMAAGFPQPNDHRHWNP